MNFKSASIILVFLGILFKYNLIHGVPLVTGKQWIVVATHPLAAQAGAKVLMAGADPRREAQALGW